jgi:hypothetical protein
VEGLEFSNNESSVQIILVLCEKWIALVDEGLYDCSIVSAIERGGQHLAYMYGVDLQ